MFGSTKDVDDDYVRADKALGNNDAVDMKLVRDHDGSEYYHQGDTTADPSA